MYEWCVPATRKNRLNNPLRQLRLILGDGEKPLGQEAFARRINMSVATIRAIEAGRRPFSEQCQKQILATLSASWNPRKRQWCLLWTTEPYKREYQDFSRFLDPDDRYLEDLSVHMLIERLLLLFGSCRVSSASPYWSIYPATSERQPKNSDSKSSWTRLNPIGIEAMIWFCGANDSKSWSFYLCTKPLKLLTWLQVEMPGAFLIFASTAPSGPLITLLARAQTRTSCWSV